MTNLMPRRIAAPALSTAALPERESILDPILSTKSLALLYGPRGLGKTFVALGIAWAAASGGSFLGWRASRPYRVVYVDGEMAAVDMKRRLALFGPAPSTLDLMLADLHPGALPDLARQDGQLALMEAWGLPELVVLDNLSSLASFQGDPDAWSCLQRFLILQRRLGRAMVLVHHANKKGFQRGTGRREDVLDLVIAMRRPADHAAREGARFELHFEKTRGLHGAVVDPIEAQMSTDTSSGRACWSWKPALDGAVHRAAALLNDGMSTPRMALQLGVSRTEGYRLRDRARQKGLI
jgi:KaiC/GvpD/RAD55 family RecA-like ATPase